MNLLSVRDLRGKSAQIWKDLPEEREIVRMVSSGELTLSLDARILTEYQEVLQ